jgi:hypothetical protein
VAHGWGRGVLPKRFSLFSYSFLKPYVMRSYSTCICGAHVSPQVLRSLFKAVAAWEHLRRPLVYETLRSKSIVTAAIEVPVHMINRGAFVTLAHRYHSHHIKRIRNSPWLKKEAICDATACNRMIQRTWSYYSSMTCTCSHHPDVSVLFYIGVCHWPSKVGRTCLRRSVPSISEPL